MKIKTLLLCALAFVGLALCSYAQTTGAVTATAGDVANPAAANIVTWLTPLLVPLIIAGVKKVLPSIPSWVLPMIAPVFGVLLDYISSLATSHSSNFLLAAALGLAGVGVREVKDQLKPAQPSS